MYLFNFLKFIYHLFIFLMGPAVRTIHPAEKKMISNKVFGHYTWKKISAMKIPIKGWIHFQTFFTSSFLRVLISKHWKRFFSLYTEGFEEWNSQFGLKKFYWPVIIVSRARKPIFISLQYANNTRTRLEFSFYWRSMKLEILQKKNANLFPSVIDACLFCACENS